MTDITNETKAKEVEKEAYVNKRSAELIAEHCQCHPDYKIRGRIDPSCLIHDEADTLAELEFLRTENVSLRASLAQAKEENERLRKCAEHFRECVLCDSEILCVLGQALEAPFKPEESEK